jgi:UDP-hydrolysing UDP-N-acetyl-D-glucosamine 2-epimerase
VRDTNSKLADLHLTTNEFTKKHLLNLGEPENLIRVIGCPSLDVITEVQKHDKLIDITNIDLAGVGCNFDLKSEFGIIMFHPDTLNDNENLIWVKEIIDSIEKSEIFWFWFWPNPDHGTSAISKEIRKSRENGKLKRVKFIINLKPEIFVKLALTAKLMLGNSSFGIREASFIGLPVINLGKRQFGRQRASNVLDLDCADQAPLLFKEISKQIDKKFEKSFIYGDGNSGTKAATVIGSWQPSIKLRKVE